MTTARQLRGENIACFNYCSSGTAQVGERCAVGFCEDSSNCPQCATGLSCGAPQNMVRVLFSALCACLPHR